ncbi:Acyl-CoA-binding domain-containing protein 4 [Glycine soja]
MKMARASSGLQYPERFYAAASYVGFDGFTSPSNFITSKFSNSTALLYNLYQQIPTRSRQFSFAAQFHNSNSRQYASIRPCSIPEPSSWKLVERSKWARFEEENPGRYSRASNSAVDPVVDVLMNHNSKVDPIIENGNTYPEIKTISTENGSQVRTQDKDVVIESFGSVRVYDQWITPPVPGQRPKARFEIPWENKLLSIVGHTKDPNESIQGVSETVVVTSVQGRVPIASEGSSLVVSSYDGEDTLLSFRGYNGRYNNEVYVLKSSHISTLQSKLIENSIPNSVYGVHNATNATRNLESETGHKWIKELAVDNVDSIAEKEELKSSLHKDKLQTLQLKQELSEAETRNSDLCKEEVVELSQKLQTIGTLQKELELLQRQKNASEQAALNAKQKQGSGGVWGSSDRVIELTG